MSMAPEDIAKGQCGVASCSKRHVLVVRVITDQGPAYTAACEDHLDTAKEFIDAVKESIPKGEKP